MRTSTRCSPFVSPSAEFALTAGAVGAVVAPVLAAIGVLVALLEDRTIQVERNGR